MFSKVIAVSFVSALALGSIACAAAPVSEDEGTIDSQAFAATKRESSSSDLTMSGKVTATCVGDGFASVRLGVELTSNSSDAVVVSFEGAFDDSTTITSNAWSKQKNRSNWAFVSRTATLASGTHTAYVCATQSSKQVCASYAFSVACDAQ
jgi:hypothetical protein